MYTFADAFQQISVATSIDALFDLVRDTQAAVEGAPIDATVLLYGGPLGEHSSAQLSAALVANASGEVGVDRLVRVDDSSVGKLLFDPTFRLKLTSLVQSELETLHPGFASLTEDAQRSLVDARFNQVYNNKDSSGNRLPIDPANPSMWDVASKNFVDQATGNFRIVAGAVDEGSILMQTELTALMSKSGSFTVDGCVMPVAEWGEPANEATNYGINRWAQEYGRGE